MSNLGTGLRIIGTLQNLSDREYVNKKNEKVTSCTIWVGVMGGKLSINTTLPQKDLNLESGKEYSFPVGTNPIEWDDKETGEHKKGVSFYLRTKGEEIIPVV